MYYTPHQDRDDQLTIRLANGDDGGSIRRLAERDSADVPGGKVLVAVVGGELRAAISVLEGEAIADPFHPTADLLKVLRMRAAQLRGKARGRRLLGFLVGRPGSLSPQPAGTLRALEEAPARRGS